jgi:hypothetical protein
LSPVTSWPMIPFEKFFGKSLSSSSIMEETNHMRKNLDNILQQNFGCCDRVSWLTLPLDFWLWTLDYRMDSLSYSQDPWLLCGLSPPLSRPSTSSLCAPLDSCIDSWLVCTFWLSLGFLLTFLRPSTPNSHVPSNFTWTFGSCMPLDFSWTPSLCVPFDSHANSCSHSHIHYIFTYNVWMCVCLLFLFLFDCT